MKKSFITTGYVFNKFDEMIQKVETWISIKDPTVWECDSDQVKARLAQKIIELSSNSYSADFESRSKLGQDSAYLNLGGLRIIKDTGKVKVHPYLWLRLFCLFFVHWIYYLFHLSISLFTRSPKSSMAATILMGIGGDFDYSDKSFVKFCKQGPITPLRDAKQLIVRTSKIPNNQTDTSYSYSKYPLIELCKTHLQFKHKIIILMHHCFAPVIFVKALLNCPINILISQDLAYLPSVRWLDNQGLIESVVLTTSAFTAQPIWMRRGGRQRFKLHLMWYAQNAIPFVYVGEKTSSNLPAMRHMQVDTHWVWTNGFKDYLRSIGQTSNIYPVGPILWYLNETKKNRDHSNLTIAIFDIVPRKPGTKNFGEFRSYYTTELMQKFVVDILDITRDVEKMFDTDISIVLKQKDRPSDRCPDYDRFIEEKIANSRNFSLIHPNANMFELLTGPICSVSVPYTSVAHISEYLEERAIFYDSLGELEPRYEKSKLIEFASSKEALKQLICEAVSEHLTNST